jgi:hypothetical protein
MPQAGFEPTIPVFEQPKTVRALDSAAKQREMNVICPRIGRVTSHCLSASRSISVGVSVCPLVYPHVV